MDVLIISDVHGNLPAMEHVLHKYKSIDLVISLGDVVNYGPWSNECVDLLDSLNSKVAILGNHEDSFLLGEYAGSNVVAKSFFNFCYSGFNRHHIIAKYIKQYSQEDCDFIHTLEDTYIYPDSDIEISKDTFIGHSHRLFCKESNGFRLVNAGSVGQNRLNIDEINYVLWNSDQNIVKLMTDPFPADTLIQEMRARKYPEICMDYILSKRNK